MSGAQHGPSGGESLRVKSSQESKCVSKQRRVADQMTRSLSTVLPTTTASPPARAVAENQFGQPARGGQPHAPSRRSSGRMAESDKPGSHASLWGCAAAMLESKRAASTGRGARPPIHIAVYHSPRKGWGCTGHSTKLPVSLLGTRERRPPLNPYLNSIDSKAWRRWVERF
jgi:hypothetical protein